MLNQYDLLSKTTRNGCHTCGFTLWTPIVSLGSCDVGLYDDARFPGRLILSLHQHHNHFDLLSPALLSFFMIDVQLASYALRQELNASRVNIAILGNQEPHVHAHLIPRYPEEESLPKNTPWQDPRDHSVLLEDEKNRIIKTIRKALTI